MKLSFQNVCHQMCEKFWNFELFLSWEIFWNFRIPEWISSQVSNNGIQPDIQLHIRPHIWLIGYKKKYIFWNILKILKHFKMFEHFRQFWEFMAGIWISNIWHPMSSWDYWGKLYHPFMGENLTFLPENYESHSTKCPLCSLRLLFSALWLWGYV